MSKLLVLIGHKKRHGKDTSADFIVGEHKASKVSFAEPLKEVIRLTFGISVEDLENFKNNNYFLVHGNGKRQYYRDILQRFGNEAMKTVFGKFVWSQLATSSIEDALQTTDIAVVSDFRFEEEYDYLVDHLDKSVKIITLNVHRPSLVQQKDTHTSETALDSFSYDYRVINDGSLEELKDKILAIIEKEKEY